VLVSYSELLPAVEPIPVRTMLRAHTNVAACLLATLLSCSVEDPADPNSGVGGTPTQGSGGVTGLAGSSFAGTAAGGAGTAGSSLGMAGTLSSAGMAGSGNSTAGSGGSAAGSSAGGQGGGATAGASGSGGGSSVPGKASAGCGKSGRPANGKVTVANEQIIDFPASYDGTKPFPLVVALHACGNPNTQWEGLFKGSAFEGEYVRLLPNTSDSGQCWSNYNNNIARILKQYDDVLANYCVDVDHVFGVGHSSGAQMLVNILAHKADAQHLNFKGVSPVAADPFNVALPMPVLYIDGKMDNQRSADSAKNAVAKFRASNMCADTSKPYTPIMGCQSSGMQVDPGCIVYDNCTVPTIWCAHNDPNYSGTQHGVPCFGVKSMYDFFKTL
jgi:polyhydroxybutyrate depolymerase